MTAKEILAEGFSFANQKETTLKDLRNIMSKLVDVERTYTEDGEARVIAKNALWAHILRGKKL